ncbi:hypothetical protein HYX14_01700 [Candidatus Woesearchaeota archaeon]|nr:hypothetical protein [Candidatus Woesearchaeota archaeon]
MRKADANMWWIIIGAVIALVVLIVLMVIFTGKVNPLSLEIASCESKGGECVSSTECKQDQGIISTAFECPGADSTLPDTSTTIRCCFRGKKG